jgi:hypothetical protein
MILASSSVHAASPTPRDGLTDRELAVQRWFSSLTFLQDSRPTPWPEWHDDGDQLGTTALRYQIAFAGYGCAAMAAKTPAYRELVQKQLADLCQRLIDVRTWCYVTRYWNYKDDPPDPCRYENVMYTGHLTQLMCLYELLTGDFRYSESGWDFVCRDGRKTHYTLGKAVERLHDLSKASPSGGICCEPGLVFAMCNDHSAASLMLFDLVHKTHYANVNSRWFDWMVKNFRDKTPGSRTFLYSVYVQKAGIFVPVSDVGADGWTLGWGYPWFPSTEFAHQGWEHVLKNAQWKSPAPDQAFAEGNAVAGCCGGARTLVRNAFLPLLAVQAEGAASPTAQKMLRWLETQHGRAVDTDADGHEDGYYYDIDPSLRIPATGNIAAALATDGPSLRQFFNTSRTAILAGPTLSHVDYPNVYVRTAEYTAPALRFTVLKGRPGFSGKTELVCDHIPTRFSLTRDGQPYNDFGKADSSVVISTDVEQEHLFQLKVLP